MNGGFSAYRARDLAKLAAVNVASVVAGTSENRVEGMEPIQGRRARERNRASREIGLCVGAAVSRPGWDPGSDRRRYRCNGTVVAVKRRGFERKAKSIRNAAGFGVWESMPFTQASRRAGLAGAVEHTRD